MPGTIAGGKKAAITNTKKYGSDFYRSIGRKGGRNGHTGGFAANPELAKIAGAKGGRKSRRGDSYSPRWRVVHNGEELFVTPRIKDAKEYIRLKNLTGKVEIIGMINQEDFA